MPYRSVTTSAAIFAAIILITDIAYLTIIPVFLSLNIATSIRKITPRISCCKLCWHHQHYQTTGKYFVGHNTKDDIVESYFCTTVYRHSAKYQGDHDLCLKLVTCCGCNGTYFDRIDKCCKSCDASCCHEDKDLGASLHGYLHILLQFLLHRLLSVCSQVLCK